MFKTSADTSTDFGVKYEQATQLDCACMFFAVHLFCMFYSLNRDQAIQE